VNVIGATDLSIWDKADRVFVVNIAVNRNLDKLRQQMKDLFPDQNIAVTAAGDLVILSGEVDDVRLPQNAQEVASLHAERVANLIKVRGNQQIQLEVRFAEVSRSGFREAGLNFFHEDGNRYGGIMSPQTPMGSFLPREPENQIPFQPSSGPMGSAFGPAIATSPFANAFSIFFADRDGFPFSAVLSLLKTNGLAKVLAEPTLVAMSGQEASFLAGGEVPIPVVTAVGQVHVEYKKFGIQLKFVPTSLSGELLHLKLMTEVSQPDPNVSVTLGGFSIPGFSSRQSETTVRLRDGQSFAIAGLLSDKTRSLIKKVPFFGELPVLGMLFRSTQFEREETELLVVITARLVKPLAPHEVPALPGENQVDDPDDFELFLLGATTRVWGEDPLPEKNGPQAAGEVGFAK
jgi:pilus assembly protein CpaC